MKLGYTAQTFIVWVSAIAISLVVALTADFNPQDRGSGYFLALISLACALVASFWNTDLVVAAIAMFFIGIPLMGIVSFFAAPAVGYGGQIIAFSAQSIVIVLAVGVFAAAKLQNSGTDRSVISRSLMLVNLVILGLAVVTSGLPAILRNSYTVVEGVTVHRVRLPKDEYSRPFIDEEAVYLVGHKGLWEVDFKNRSRSLITPLTIPMPSELGIRGVSPLDGVPGSPNHAVIWREDATRLTVAMPYPLIGTGDGVDWSRNLWFSVDLDSRSVSDWRLSLDEIPKHAYAQALQLPVRFGKHKLAAGNTHNMLRVSSSEVSGDILLDGFPDSQAVAHGKVCIVTKKCSIYLIDFDKVGPGETLDVFEPVDVDVRSVFPVRHSTATTTMQDGSFVLSPDGTMSLVCKESRENGQLIDTKFIVFRTNEPDAPILVISARESFPGQGTAPNPMLSSFAAVWAGDSGGFYLIGTPAYSPNSSAQILYFDLQGTHHQVTDKAFLLEGEIVGSIPGTRLLVTQTFETWPETGLFRTRVRVANENGDTVATFGDPSGENNCQFEDGSHEGCVAYSIWPDRIYLGFLSDGSIKEVGKGLCPRFKPDSDLSVAFVSVDADSLTIMEYDVSTGEVREVAWDRFGTVQASWVTSSGQRLYQVNDLVWDDADTLYILLEGNRVYRIETADN